VSALFNDVGYGTAAQLIGLRKQLIFLFGLLEKSGLVVVESILLKQVLFKVLMRYGVAGGENVLDANHPARKLA
jgi:hypothetical protein